MVSPSQRKGGRLGKRELFLFIGLVVAYNVNLRQVSSHDTYASRFVPISILRDGDLILDEFVPDALKLKAGDEFFSDYFVYVRGHFYDSHPPVGPLLALPVYALPAWIGIPSRPELIANMFSKLAASLMVAFSGVLLFRVSRRILEAISTSAAHDAQQAARVALFAAVAYGLGTSVWSTASLAMWTHTPAVLGFAVALWALTGGRTSVAGFAAAAACFSRPATAPAVALLGLYLVHRAARNGWQSEVARQRRMDVLRYAVSAAVTGVLGVLYNYWLFGNAVGGAPFRTGIWVEELGTTGMFTGSLPVGLAGLLISPSRGILIYSPVVLVAAYGAARSWRASLESERTPAPFSRADAILLARYLSLAAIVILLTYSKFIVWWGGHGYGPRYLTDGMPFIGPLFALGLSPVSKTMSRARAGKVAAIAVLTYSIAIQAIGAFCWPSSWTLNNNPPYRFRLWDWRESQIELCIRDGPRIDPSARRLFAFLARHMKIFSFGSYEEYKRIQVAANKPKYDQAYAEDPELCQFTERPSRRGMTGRDSTRSRNP